MADPIDTALRVVSSALPVGMPPGHEITDAGTCIVEVAELRVVLAEVDRLRAALTDIASGECGDTEAVEAGLLTHTEAP